MGVVALGVGCVPSEPPAFHMNMVEAVSNELSPEYQQEIADVLGALFGTPDEPFALPVAGLDPVQLRMAAGPAWSDKKGVNHGLYRKHCVHCHGISGDGRGPTARFLNPYPRDYRQAVYKFKSTYNASKPTDKDLLAVLTNGVPGTAMPSFSLLPSSEVEALVEYVKYLSIRGQMDTALVRYVYDELGEEDAEDENGEPILDEEGEPVINRIPLDPIADADQREAIADLLSEILDGWNQAPDQVVAPEEDQIPEDDRTTEAMVASIEKGRELFYGAKANCLKCHGPTALGDGQQDDQNKWNKDHKKFIDATVRMAESIKRQASEEGLDDNARQQLKGEKKLLAIREAVIQSLYPIRNAIPRNLRQGVYRGGRRRIDIFWRIYAGIPGTPMPATGPASPGAKGTLTETEIWNLVDYVLSLPYEAPSRPQQALPVNADVIF